MLKRLKLENFKAWREADLQFGNDRLSSARTAPARAAFQLLLLLKQTKNATDRGLVLDFGGPA